MSRKNKGGDATKRIVRERERKRERGRERERKGDTRQKKVRDSQRLNCRVSNCPVLIKYKLSV